MTRKRRAKTSRSLEVKQQVAHRGEAIAEIGRAADALVDARGEAVTGEVLQALWAAPERGRRQRLESGGQVVVTDVHGTAGCVACGGTA